MNTEIVQSAITICDRCQGSGRDGAAACRPCFGFGQAAVQGETALFWGRRVNGFNLAVARLRRWLDGLVNVLAVGGLILGLWSVAKLVLGAKDASDLLTLWFWTRPHVALLGFWFGAGCAAFLHYRIVVAASRRQPIRLRHYQETTERVVPVADFWAWFGGRGRGGRLDISRTFSSETNRVVDEAFRLARRFRQADVTPLHLFAAALATPSGADVFGRLGLPVEQLLTSLRSALSSLPSTAGEPSFAAVAPTLLRSYLLASAARQSEVRCGELLLAAALNEPRIVELLVGLGSSRSQLENAVGWQRVDDLLRQRGGNFRSAARRKPRSDVNRSMTAMATPYLDRLSRDLTREAAAGRFDPILEREREFAAIFRAIEGGQRSVILVGEPGTGKTALLEGIAQLMVEEDVPAVLQDKRLVLIDIARLVAGATASEAQQRLLMAMNEVAQAGNVVLAVPNVAAMIGISAGNSGGLDLAQTFGEELARGYCFALATATPAEYAAVEGSPLGRSLARVDLPEPEFDQAVRIVEAKVSHISARLGVHFAYGALESAVRLADRHLHDLFLPEKAIHVVEEAAQAVRRRSGAGATVVAEDVADVIADKTGIPLQAVAADESARLLRLEETLHARVIGQDAAIRAVASALRRSRSGMRDAGRPIANFLFLGPTGVGKTELAKALAAANFGDESAMIRLDMSEYQEISSLARLMGEDGGTTGGQLTEAVRHRPFSLVLLDEIEKAHPDVLNVFLQVMDDGRLTDNGGRTVDFTNVILIATSNAGAQFIQDAMRQGQSPTQVREGLLNGELKEHFRPEFLNRFDEIIVFAPLDQLQLQAVARLMLGAVTRRLEQRGIDFSVTDAAVAELVTAGFDPVYGARPLRRAIQDRVDSVVADALLKGELRRGQQATFDVGGKLIVE